jgi:glucose dehydrogenase
VEEKQAVRIFRQRIWAVSIIGVALITVVAATMSMLVLVRAGNRTTVVNATTTATAAPPTPSPSTTPVPLPAGSDWTTYRADIYGTGANTDGQITAANVAKLKTRWVNTYVPGYHPFESTPAELDGVVYVTAGHSFHAIDFHTGKALWNFNDVGKEDGTLFSSVAIDSKTRLAYYGSPDGRIYAVNTVTHQGAWNVQLDKSKGAFTWSSPLLANGKVYVGLASHDDNPCVRGAVFALDPITGTTLWTHYMVPAGTLGGSVWSSLSADPAEHAIIATTGNPCDEPPGSVQGGISDAQQDAILALDWNTGATLWQYTAIVNDQCDCDFGQGPVTFTTGGKTYIVAGNKAGIVYALNPPSQPHGKPHLVWQRQITPAGYLGSGGIFSPPTYANGVVYFAGGPTVDGACGRGAVWALSAVSGAVLWRQCTVAQVVGAASISSGVLFVAQQDILVAYSATTGHVLWKASQPGPAWGGVSIARGSVMSASVAGKLYCYSIPTGS